MLPDLTPRVRQRMRTRARPLRKGRVQERKSAVPLPARAKRRRLPWLPRSETQSQEASLSRRDQKGNDRLLEGNLSDQPTGPHPRKTDQTLSVLLVRINKIPKI